MCESESESESRTVNRDGISDSVSNIVNNEDLDEDLPITAFISPMHINEVDSPLEATVRPSINQLVCVSVSESISVNRSGFSDSVSKTVNRPDVHFALPTSSDYPSQSAKDITVASRGLPTSSICMWDKSAVSNTPRSSLLHLLTDLDPEN